jgi:hypothetical protein
VDAPPEALCLLNPVHVAVDDRQLVAARQQHLRGQLAEAPEADHEHRAGSVREVLLRRHALVAAQEALPEAHHEGRQRHGDGDEGDEQARMVLPHHPGRGRGA